MLLYKNEIYKFELIECLGQIHPNSPEIFIIVKGCLPSLQQSKNRLIAMSIPES